jgi:hypothetical protein
MSNKEEPDEIKNNMEVWDTKIVPLLDQIREICKEHGIPMIVAFQVTAEGVMMNRNFEVNDEAVAGNLRCAALGAEGLINQVTVNPVAIVSVDPHVKPN